MKSFRSEQANSRPPNSPLSPFVEFHQAVRRTLAPAVAKRMIKASYAHKDGRLGLLDLTAVASGCLAGQDPLLRFFYALYHPKIRMPPPQPPPDPVSVPGSSTPSSSSGSSPTREERRENRERIRQEETAKLIARRRSLMMQFPTPNLPHGAHRGKDDEKMDDVIDGAPTAIAEDEGVEASERGEGSKNRESRAPSNLEFGGETDASESGSGGRRRKRLKRSTKGMEQQYAEYFGRSLHLMPSSPPASSSSSSSSSHSDSQLPPLPIDCWMHVATFLDSQEDFLAISRSVPCFFLTLSRQYPLAARNVNFVIRRRACISCKARVLDNKNQKKTKNHRRRLRPRRAKASSSSVATESIPDGGFRHVVRLTTQTLSLARNFDPDLRKRDFYSFQGANDRELFSHACSTLGIAMPNLTVLRLRGTLESDFDTSQSRTVLIRGLESLREVDVEALTHLKGLSTTKDLTVVLAELPRLRSVRVCRKNQLDFMEGRTNSPVSKSSWNLRLAKDVIPFVSEVSCEGFVLLNPTDSSEWWASLESLVLVGAQAGVAGEVITGMPKLRHVTLESLRVPIARIDDLPALETLSVYRSPLGMEALQNFPSLQRVVIDHERDVFAGPAVLRNAPKLREVLLSLQYPFSVASGSSELFNASRRGGQQAYVPEELRSLQILRLQDAFLCEAKTETVLLELNGAVTPDLRTAMLINCEIQLVASLPNLDTLALDPAVPIRDLPRLRKLALGFPSGGGQQHRCVGLPALEELKLVASKTSHVEVFIDDLPKLVLVECSRGSVRVSEGMNVPEHPCLLL